MLEEYWLFAAFPPCDLDVLPWLVELYSRTTIIFYVGSTIRSPFSVLLNHPNSFGGHRDWRLVSKMKWYLPTSLTYLSSSRCLVISSHKWSDKYNGRNLARDSTTLYRGMLWYAETRADILQYRPTGRVKRGQSARITEAGYIIVREDDPLLGDVFLRANRLHYQL